MANLSIALDGVLQTPARMHADPQFCGRGVTLALVDSGFYPHADLTTPRNRIRAWVDATLEPVEIRYFGQHDKPVWPNWDACRPTQWHGMMTSVVAAGCGQYPGLASEADVVLVQTSEAGGRILEASIERALRWLRENAERLRLRIVNLSVVGDHPAKPGNPIDAAASALVRRGVLVVAAAGNDGIRKLLPPSTCPHVITVGGLDQNQMLWHSNYGESTSGALKPEFVAPSIWVVAPLLPGTAQHGEAAQLFSSQDEDAIEQRNLVSPHYKLVEGTSFSAPIVASVLACMVEANPALTPDVARQCLAHACQPIEGAPPEQQGLGGIDAALAVSHALRARGGAVDGYSTSPHATSGGTVFLLRNRDAFRVQVFGSWNGWTVGLEARQVDRGVWRAAGPVFSKGRHEYKFLVDGHWLTDPANPCKAADDRGGFNSVLVTG
ncbi:MAG TPA: S8 family serine peptidase [Bryobacteraceae bacterium]|nr:S8 family serine peptidase [Bryobacteraceae bacterium]